MSELLLCGACLNNEDLIHIDSGQLRDKYNAICGVETQHVTGASQYLCVMCVAYLNKMMRLRELCLKSAQVFQLKSISSECEEQEIKCTDDPLEITPMLSFPKVEKFTYSETNYINNRNRGHKIIGGPLSKTATLCYEINERNNSIEATNNNETKPKVIITEDIKLEVSSLKDHNSYNSILNDYSNNYDSFENYDDMFDANNSNTSFPDANTAVNNLNDSKPIIKANDLQNNSQNEKKVITDSIQLPEEANAHSKKLRTVEYFAKLELLPDNEARAAYELYTRKDNNSTCLKDTKNNKTKKEFVECKTCNQLVFSRLLGLHKDTHNNISDCHCAICFVNFPNQNTLNNHNVILHMFKYICRICSEVSFTLEQAEMHYKDDHCLSDLEYRLKLDEIESNLKGFDVNKKDYLSNYFTKTAITKEEQVKAFKQKELKPKYVNASIKCGVCYKVFIKPESLTKHMVLHIIKKSTPLECEICRLCFRSEYDLMIHTKRKHEYKYACKECGHVVYDRADAVEHRSVDHVTKRNKNRRAGDNKCNYCDTQFETNLEYKKHLPSHYTKFCTMCGNIYSSEIATCIHVSKAHGEVGYNLYIKETYDPDRSSQFYCGECQVQFHNAVAYNRHLTLKEHKDATTVECNTEDNQNEVEIENIVSSRVNRVKNCHICGVYLRTRDIARDHYRDVHTLSEYHKQIYTTTFKCEHCDYTSMRPKTFKRHVRKHTVDYTIPCQICGRRFSTVARMKNHQYVHSDERPYECAHCNKTFKTQKKTQLHIRTVHLKIPYMPWIRRAERRKRERALERQKREGRTEQRKQRGKDENEYNYETEREDSQQDMDVNMAVTDEEQHMATEYLNRLALANSGNVVFATHSRN